MNEVRKTFTDAEIEKFKPSEKIGLVSCINPEGLPHMALLTSIMANGPQKLTVGQFCLGLSKWYMKEKKNIAFLILTLDKKMWRGRAIWTHERTEGPEYIIYNNIPMFRYNSYFGINKVHYLDLVETGGEESLPMGGIIKGSLLTMIGKGAAKTGREERILRPFAEDLINKLDSLKFLSFIDTNGFPAIIPVIQCQAADSRRLVFSPSVYSDELKMLKEHDNVALYALNFKMQTVLLRGVFLGYRNYRGIKMGVIDINWVYNSMPPIHDQIYPEKKLEAVVNF